MGFRTVYGNTISENGWPMVDEGSCTWVKIPGTDVTLEIQNGWPLQVMRAFAADFNAEVEPLRDQDSACWTAGNSVATSNHLSGTAMDLNWDSHPFQVADAGFDPAKLARVRELLDWYEGTIFWGNDWDSPKDAMHFQMGYDTFDNPKTGDFVVRKIRADGLSRRRTGDAPAPPPSADAAQILSDAMGGRLDIERYRELLPAVSEALRACECTNVDRIAMWCAQIGHESAGLYYTEEIASGSAYEGRTDLGNTQPGDGVRFKGRSWIQVTGRANYTHLSEWAFEKGLVPSPSFFVDDPAALGEGRYAGLGAAWYWVAARPDINSLCDARDIDTVTRRINGGLNGLADRRSRYNNALGMGDKLLALIQGEDDLSAEAERKIDQILGILTNPVPSQSIYADPGEPVHWELHELIKNDDGMIHSLYVEAAARAGDLNELARVARTAAGKGVVTDPAVVTRARNVLAEIEATRPDILKAFIAQNGAS